jgi:uncharacterized repeat protein (TIGR03843 family)
MIQKQHDMQDHLPPTPAIKILSHGEIRVIGRFLWGSNYTYLTEIKSPGKSLNAVYKPSRGERPLWDFAGGSLAAREVAAYLTSDLLGWDLVPPTVFRDDGPIGPGSLQLYVDADAEHHYFTFSENEKSRLRPVALFDLVINNADRKGGHILMGADGHLWSIDHGICFHVDDKLRTVIWDFSEETIPQELVTDLGDFLARLEHSKDVADRYLGLLSNSEFEAMIVRIKHLLENPCFPKPSSEWSYPWPLV